MGDFSVMLNVTTLLRLGAVKKLLHGLSLKGLLSHDLNE